ncbi:MAG: ABC transporter permease [Chitinophagales bacterium]|nr:ABC transporter permease [Chitinophagales bacterium]
MPLNYNRRNAPFRRSLRRLLKNRSAVVGLIVISVAVILAFLGYSITPDASPSANEQTLQINHRPPGFKAIMLKVRKNREVASHSFFYRMLYGQDNPYELVPIVSYSIEGANLIYHELSTSTPQGIKKSIPLAEVAYAISPDKPEIKVQNEEVSFYDLSNKYQTVQLSVLREQVAAHNIEDRTFLLGTDLYGRDILSRLIIGIRVSLSVGLVAVIISMGIGILLGAIAGYFRGWVDDIIMWLINVVWSIPTILLVFAMTMAFDAQDRSMWQLFIAIGITMWVDAARIVRGQVMSTREVQFVEAARSLGYSHTRTMFIHILPNITGPLIVVAAANFASAILIEAGLSFLGIGVDPTTPSWGRMLSENYGYIISANVFLALVPGIAIMLMVLAFNLLGNGLRDAMDVKTSLQGK